MVNGCPSSSIYPWQSDYNTLIPGRQKLLSDESCEHVAQSYATELHDFEGFSYDNVFKSCQSDSEFIKETPDLRMKTLQALKQAAESHRINFGGKKL